MVLLKTAHNHLRLQWVKFLKLMETLCPCRWLLRDESSDFCGLGHLTLQIRQRVFRMSHQIALLLTGCWKHFSHSGASFKTGAKSLNLSCCLRARYVDHLSLSLSFQWRLPCLHQAWITCPEPILSTHLYEAIASLLKFTTGLEDSAMAWLRF